MAGIRMQQDVPDRGRLQVWVNTRLQGRPIAGAKVSVSYSGDPGNVLEEVRTDSDGRSPVLDLPTYFSGPVQAWGMFFLRRKRLPLMCTAGFSGRISRPTAPT